MMLPLAIAAGCIGIDRILCRLNNLDDQQHEIQQHETLSDSFESKVEEEKNGDVANELEHIDYAIGCLIDLQEAKYGRPEFKKAIGDLIDLRADIAEAECKRADPKEDEDPGED